MMEITVLEKSGIKTGTWGFNFVIYPRYPDESQAIILHREAAEELAADIAAYLASPPDDDEETGDPPTATAGE